MRIMSMKGLAVAVALLTASCSNASNNANSATAHGTIPVVTTFSTLNSFAQAVGGDRVTIRNLVPIGASPEDYQPSPQDVATLSDGRLLIENGTGIETWLQHTIQNAQNPTLRVLVLSQGLPHVDTNPHLWMDPVLARAYTDKVRDALSAVDPSHRAAYAANAAVYRKKLAALQQSIARQIATIPPSHRTMIVFHNAWQYYNNRFGIRTIGVIELSPGQEPNPQYIAHLVDLAKRYQVRAVFAEPEYSPKLAQTLARSAGIRTVTNLYDDSISSDPRVHDYISMLQYDTNVIVQALK